MIQKAVPSVLQAIGNTPLVRLNKVVPPHCADVLVKLEYYNPTEEPVSVRHEDFHDHFVPVDIQTMPRYTNYAPDMITAQFNKHFRLVGDTTSLPG